MKPSIPALAIVLAAVAATALSGCATRLQSDLQRDTVLAIGVAGTVSSAQVAITDLRSGTTCYTDCTTTWRAQLPDGSRYDCTAPPDSDATDRRTVCVKKS